MDKAHKLKYQKMIEHLASIRQLKGITQSKLSECLGKPQSYVSKYENLERRLDLLEVMAICECLDYEINELISTLQETRVYFDN